MEFVYEKLEHLPKLAWCARVVRHVDKVQVFHGSQVETRPTGFVEGAWNGPFESLSLSTATVLCGTGAQLEGSRVRFCASSDRLSPLFSITKNESIWVSNSPVFVLSAAGEKPAPIYPFYMYDLIRIWRQGLYNLSGRLKTSSNFPMCVHFGALLSIGADLSSSLDARPLGPPFHDFDSYRNLLIEGVREVARNAADPHRTTPFGLLAALSQGYDSCATAALAKHAGCTKAMTFFDSRAPDPYSDAGSGIASSLRMTCSEYDRWSYLLLENQPELEFGFVPFGSNVTQASCESVLRGNLLISGRYGDKIWAKDSAAAADEFVCTWEIVLGGVSQIDFRLRVGFVEFAPACIGARYNRTIHGIAHSEEMRPWSIGGAYDRPIPRRLAEEAGLRREDFGRRKAASGYAHIVYRGDISASSRDSYRRFTKERNANVNRLYYWFWRTAVRMRHTLWNLKVLILRGNRPRIVPSSAIQRRFPFLMNRSPIPIPWEFMFTFQWSFASIADRYAVTFGLAADSKCASIIGTDSPISSRTDSISADSPIRS